MKKELIVKHNQIIESKYNMTTTEIKIIAKLTSLIQKDDENFKEHLFITKTLLEELNLGQENYTALEQSIDKLITRKIEIIQTDDKRLVTTFLSSCLYDNSSESKIILSFDPKLKPYFLQLKNNFTKYYLENILEIKSFYSIRIYELLKQYEDLKERTVKVSYLKDILDLNETRDKRGNIIKKEKYKLYGHFKTKVLLVAQKEINEKTDLKIDFEEIKIKRKVTGLKFIIKNQNEINIKQVEEELQENQPQTPILSVDIDLEEILAYIPANYLQDEQKELNDLIKNAFESFDKEYIIAQIEYTKKRAPQKFEAYLTKSILSNYAKVENKKQKEKELEKERLKEEFKNLSSEEHKKIALSFYNTLSNEEKDNIKNDMKNKEFFKRLEKEDPEDAIATFIRTSSFEKRLIKFYMGE